MPCVCARVCVDYICVLLCVVVCVTVSMCVYADICNLSPKYKYSDKSWMSLN